jgi:hypothetical protein
MSVSSLNFTSQIPQEKPKKSTNRESFDRAVLVGGIAGTAVDMYYNNTKVLPKKYLAEIEKIEKAEGLSDAIKNALTIAKESLQRVINKKYSLMDNFFNTEIPGDSGDVLKTLASIEKPAESSPIFKNFIKLAKIGEEHSLDGNIFAKTLKRIILKQNRFGLIGLGVGALGGLIYQANKKQS